MDMNKKYGNASARNARGAGFITSRIRKYKKEGYPHGIAYAIAKTEWAIEKARAEK